MIKILIVSFTLKEKYYDGFYSALNILKNKYMVDFWKINFDKKKEILTIIILYYLREILVLIMQIM